MGRDVPGGAKNVSARSDFRDVHSSCCQSLLCSCSAFSPNRKRQRITVAWLSQSRAASERRFRVTNHRRKARAVIFYQFGCEVRAAGGSQEELVSSQVCRTQDEVLTTANNGKPECSRRAR